MSKEEYNIDSRMLGIYDRIGKQFSRVYNIEMNRPRRYRTLKRSIKKAARSRPGEDQQKTSYGGNRRITKRFRRYFQRGLHSLAEKKMYRVFNATSSNIVSTGTVVCCNPMQKGDDLDNRTGQKVVMDSIYITFKLAYSQTGLGNVAVALIWNKFPDGVATSLGNIYDTGSTSANAYTLAHLNWDSKGTYKVLAKQMYCLSSNDSDIKFGTFYVKKYLRTLYKNTNAGDETDIANGSLLFVFWSDFTSNYPTITYTSSYRFIDC